MDLKSIMEDIYHLSYMNIHATNKSQLPVTWIRAVYFIVEKCSRWKQSCDLDLFKKNIFFFAGNT